MKSKGTEKGSPLKSQREVGSSMSLFPSNSRKSKDASSSAYLSRRYIYERTYAEVIEFQKLQKIRTPNHKENFSFALEQYINYLKAMRSK